MTWGTINVRNTCPFPVTFYALAGPTIEVPANSSRSASACLIWFSTRVKGGGTIINSGWFQQHAQDYFNELNGECGIDPSDTEDGGSGAAAGSILGSLFGYLDPTTIWMVKNTRLDNDGITLFFGAKKEAVYGNSNLVVYATLDPACKVPGQTPLRYWWSLHLEEDTGQQFNYGNDPPYAAPDLTKYRDGMFFRLRNVKSNQLLYAKTDGTQPRTAISDSSFNPLTNPEYWSISPNGTDQTHNIKILSPQTGGGWFTAYGPTTFGLYPLGYADYSNQHWTIKEVQKRTGNNPEIVKLLSDTGPYCLVAADDWTGSLFSYPDIEGAEDQQWRPESFLVDASDVPDGTPIRLMHAMDGRYITLVEGGGHTPYGCSVKTYGSWGQVFLLKKVESGWYICDIYERAYLYYSPSSWGPTPLFFDNPNNCPLNDAFRTWYINTNSKRDGFFLTNGQSYEYGSNLLWRDDGGFALYGGDYADQYWVAQLD